MSEYTQYFAVKASSMEQVRDQLNEAKIVSVVDADAGLDFLDEPEERKEYNWVTVTAPAVSELNGEFSTYQDRFDDMKNVFGEFVYFFQEENFTDWLIKIYCQGETVEKRVYQDEPLSFTAHEEQVFLNLFGKPFAELSTYLEPGEGSGFLEFVGIPYLEMNDQDLVDIDAEPEEGKYSFLADEVDDLW